MTRNFPISKVTSDGSMIQKSIPEHQLFVIDTNCDGSDQILQMVISYKTLYFHSIQIYAGWNFKSL